MNKLLQLKGTLISQARKNGRAEKKLSQSVTLAKVNELINELAAIANYWNTHTEIGGIFLSVHYTRIIPKSSRIQTLIKNSDETIRGSKYSIFNNKRAHVFIHYLEIKQFQRIIDLLNKCQTILNKLAIPEITNEILITLKNHYFSNELSFKNFFDILIDISQIIKFDIEFTDIDTDESQLVTIYKTTKSANLKDLLKKFGITTLNIDVFGDDTFLLNSHQLGILKAKAPYLIAMNVQDITKFETQQKSLNNNMPPQLPPPTNEPIIGVFDTLFDKNVYFSDWVDYVPAVIKELEEYNDANTFHGTTISSIIVDGPSLNPDLEDNCGRFRVKHFGIAIDGKNSTTHIMNQVYTAVRQNPHIKVWNFSLGNDLPINENFISAEAALFDKIQKDFDVTFVISGTNNPKCDNKSYPIGSPADSINSIIVNAIRKNNTPTSYTRTGPVLSFFTKPDCSYYGGDISEPLTACSGKGLQPIIGTSYAAPWITRKVAFMRYKLQLSREITKALLIDACIGWEKQNHKITAMGHGIVPIKINDIISTKDNEIKFFVEGIAEKYATFTYNLPVPIYREHHPFKAKATMCYFPKCSRTQGVDYTTTELDLHFGRIQLDKTRNTPSINPINNNYQNEDLEGIIHLKEDNRRTEFGKWDNVKHIAEITTNPRPISTAINGLWGIKINKTKRLQNDTEEKLPFGIVVTLKEITGSNRIDDFTQQCLARGWLIKPITIETMVDIYAKGEENIELE